MKVDILAIGVHPDDVELGCSGVLINEIGAGKTAAIIDLTQGELGSRGTIDTRYEEAAEAASIIGVIARENLKFRDGFFVNDEAHKLKLIQSIRKYGKFYGDSFTVECPTGSGNQMNLEQVEGGLGQRKAGFRSKRRRKCPSQKVGHEPGRAFGGL